jgi:hypothetical protein
MKNPCYEQGNCYESLSMKLEPWGLPSEKKDVRFPYTDVEFN